LNAIAVQRFGGADGALQRWPPALNSHANTSVFYFEISTVVIDVERTPKAELEAYAPYVAG